MNADQKLAANLGLNVQMNAMNVSKLNLTIKDDPSPPDFLLPNFGRFKIEY